MCGGTNDDDKPFKSSTCHSYWSKWYLVHISFQEVLRDGLGFNGCQRRFQMRPRLVQARERMLRANGGPLSSSFVLLAQRVSDSTRQDSYVLVWS